MECNLELRRKAEKFMRNAPRDVADRISKRLQQLAKNPECEERLRGPLRELCKTRVGSHRIVYLLKPCNIIVVAIGRRESFYDKLTRSL